MKDVTSWQFDEWKGNWRTAARLFPFEARQSISMCSYQQYHAAKDALLCSDEMVVRVRISKRSNSGCNLNIMGTSQPERWG